MEHAAGPDIEVKEAPPYNRQNFAYMDPPAPMEKGAKSTYYIAPPDPKWTKAVQAAFVLDRIREMMRKYKRMPIAEMVDVSINAVLPRTLMTATTVFLALLSLVLFGGHVIQSFSLAMMWGIFVATYSSIFICSPILIYLGVRNLASESAKSDSSVD